MIQRPSSLLYTVYTVNRLIINPSLNQEWTGMDEEWGLVRNAPKIKSRKKMFGRKTKNINFFSALLVRTFEPI